VFNEQRAVDNGQRVSLNERRTTGGGRRDDEVGDDGGIGFDERAPRVRHCHVCDVFNVKRI